MKKRGRRHFTKEQHLAAVREVESGGRVTEIAARFGVSEQSVYRWIELYSGAKRAATRSTTVTRLQSAGLAQANEVDLLRAEVLALRQMLNIEQERTRRSALPRIAPATLGRVNGSVSAH